MSGATPASTPPRHRRWGGVLVGAVCLVGGAAGGWWAGTTLLRPPPDVLAAPDYTLVAARTTTIGLDLRLNTAATWVPTGSADGAADGVITSVAVKPGNVVGPGDVIYTVDLRPVVAAAGDVPPFRDLTLGARGADVAQLQRFLAVIGHDTGQADGVFDTAVKTAVRAWQHDMGVEQTGVVLRGDIMYLPQLPARITPAAGLEVGREVSGTYPVVSLLPDAPVFAIALGEAQAGLIHPGTAVDLAYAGHAWTAIVSDVRGTAGSFQAELAGAGGGSVCGADCSAIPLPASTTNGSGGQGAETSQSGGVLIPSVIHVIPQESGVSVPAAAVVTTADGRTGVTLADGTFREVKLGTTASGLIVVDGVADGEPVRVPGQEP